MLQKPFLINHQLSNLLPTIRSRCINFNIDNPTYEDFNKIYEGQIIKYRVSPFPFLRVGWTTEITHVEKPISFVDKQIAGPFSFWEHEHIFKENSSGLYAYDIVTFKLPLGIMGRILGGWIVKNQLKNIFEYRKNRLEKIFNTIDSEYNGEIIDIFVQDGEPVEFGQELFAIKELDV